MRVSELKTAMQFALDSVKGRNTVPALDALIAVIRQNAKVQPNQQQQPITDQKKKHCFKCLLRLS